ncbi:MAG: DUF2231 domain-containing protein [Bacteriovoracia bacterium]
MQVPIHPLIVHFPMVLTFVLPVLILVFAYMIKTNKMTPKGWLIIIGMQLAVVISGYVSLETGETEEHRVEKVVSKKLIHEHEEAAEIFVGASVVALVLSIGAFFLRKELGFRVQMIVALITVLAAYLAYRTGVLGGELVYKHGAAEAYTQEAAPPEGLLPTPGQDTSESPFPENENESLKVDDSDYGNPDEVIESPDDNFREED